MFKAIWSRASYGDEQSIDAALKIMDRRARLLGLDGPDRPEVLRKQAEPIDLSLSARAALAAKLRITLKDDR